MINHIDNHMYHSSYNLFCKQIFQQCMKQKRNNKRWLYTKYAAGKKMLEQWKFQITSHIHYPKISDNVSNSFMYKHLTQLILDLINVVNITCKCQKMMISFQLKQS